MNTLNTILLTHIIIWVILLTCVDVGSKPTNGLGEVHVVAGCLSGVLVARDLGFCFMRGEARMKQERSETFRPVNARIPPHSYAPSEGYFTGSLRGELDIRKLIFSNVVRFTATGVCTVNPYYVFSLLVSLKQSFLEAKLPLAAPLVGRVMFRARNIPCCSTRR